LQDTDLNKEGNSAKGKDDGSNIGCAQSILQEQVLDNIERISPDTEWTTISCGVNCDADACKLRDEVLAGL